MVDRYETCVREQAEELKEARRLRTRLQRTEELLSKAEARIRILSSILSDKLGNAGNDTENEIRAFLGGRND